VTEFGEGILEEGGGIRGGGTYLGFMSSNQSGSSFSSSAGGEAFFGTFDMLAGRGAEENEEETGEEVADVVPRESEDGEGIEEEEEREEEAEEEEEKAEEMEDFLKSSFGGRDF